MTNSADVDKVAVLQRLLTAVEPLAREDTTRAFIAGARTAAQLLTEEIANDQQGRIHR